MYLCDVVEPARKCSKGLGGEGTASSKEHDPRGLGTVRPAQDGLDQLPCCLRGVTLW